MNLGSDDPGGHCSSLTGCQGYTIYSSGWTQYWASCDTGLTATDTSAVSFFLTILNLPTSDPSISPTSSSP